MSKIDVRGMSCPQPVLITKNALQSNPESIQIIADDSATINNISRFLQNEGYKYEIKDTDEDYIIYAKK